MSNTISPREEIANGYRFSYEEAVDVSMDLLRSNPAVVGQWIEEQVNDHRSTVCWITAARAMRDGSRDLTVPELLAVIASGLDGDLVQARWQLMQHFEKAHIHVAGEDARDIMRAQEREDMMQEMACEFDQIDAF